MKEFYQHDITILENAVQHPVRQMIAVEVNSPTQTRQLARQIEDWSIAPHRAKFSFDANTDDAHQLWEQCRVAVQEWPVDEDKPNLLIIGDESPTNARIQHGEAQLPTSVGFWRTMNQLREKWDGLPAQIVFLITSPQYFFLTTEADHFKRWMPLKLHCLVEPSNPQLKERTREFFPLVELALTSDEFIDDLEDKDFAKESRPRLNERLRKAHQRGETKESLARRYYLPLMAADITLENWEGAKTYSQWLSNIDLPLKPQLRWLRLRSYLEFYTGQCEEGLKIARQFYQVAQLQGESNDKLLALLTLKQFYEKLGDINKVEATFQELLKLTPKNTDILALYAIFLTEERNDSNRAEEFFLQAIEAEPKDVHTLNSYAIFLKNKRHDFDRAEEFYLRAIDANPRYANTLGSYALFLENERHDFDRAEKFYLRAIEAKPKHADNLGNYASFLKNQRHDFDRAEEFYLHAIEIDPKHANTLNNYALFLRNERHNFDGAEEFYIRAVKSDPKNASILSNYANFLCDERYDLERAEKFYLRAIEADPKHAATLSNYANFLYKEHYNFDVAEKFYRGSVESAPNVAQVSSNYAIFLCQARGNYESAEAYFAKAVAIDENNPERVISYAAILLIQGKLEEGKQVLSRAAALPELPENAALAIAFHRYIHFPREKPAPLIQVKKLLKQGVTGPTWNFDLNIERARQDGHPNLALLNALAKVIAGERKISTLNNFPEWQRA